MPDLDDPTYFHRRNLPHFQQTGRVHFITFCTWDREVLPPEARRLILNHCLHDHGTKLLMHCAVVMPDHVHLLLTPLNRDDGQPHGLPGIMAAIKGASAHSVNRLLGRKGRLWQDESFDRVLRHDESARQKAEYIAHNPVRRGLATAPDDYPFLWRVWIEGEAKM